MDRQAHAPPRGNAAPPPSGGAPGRRRLAPRDLRIVQQAGGLITDLGEELDRRLARESRASERLRMLRETTNRIIRTANDAAQAHARASRAIDAELRRTDGNAALARDVRSQLREARAEVLAAIAAARRRYAATDDLPSTGTPQQRAAP